MINEKEQFSFSLEAPQNITIQDCNGGTDQNDNCPQLHFND
jgi:hypothetical protein